MGNYLVTINNGTLTVNRKEVTLTAKDSTKVYDGTELTQPGFTLTPLASTDNHVFNVVMGDTCNITNVGTRKNVIAKVDDVTVTAGTATAVGNYLVTIANGLLKITPATMEVVATGYNQDYDGVVHSISVTAPDGATVTYSTDGTTYSPDNPSYTNVGENTVYYKVEKDNFTTVTGSETVKITAKAVTLTAKDSTKVFDGTALTQPGFTLTPLASTDNHVFNVVMGDTCTITNVGTRKNVIAKVDDVTVTAGTATAVGNYLVTINNGTLTINRKAVTITANNASKTYDGSALTEGGFTATNLESGDSHTFTVVMTDESTITNYGTKPNVIATVDGVVVTTGAPTAVGNYTVTTANGTLTINKRDLTIKLDTTKVYDGTAFVCDYASSHNGWTVTGLQGSATLTEGMLTSSDVKAETYTDSAATYAVNISTPFATSDNISNYSVTYDFKQVIAPATLTITANNKTTKYGVVNHDFTYTPTGFVNGETASVVSGTVTYEGNATQTTTTSAPGIYTITPVVSGLSAANYNLTAVNGTLTIDNSDSTITIASPTHNWTYDGASHSDHGYTVTYGGTTLTGVPDGNSYKYTISSTQDVITITPAASAVVTGYTPAAEPNAFTYSIAYSDRYATPTVTTGTLSIDKRMVSFTGETATRTYTGNEIELTDVTVGGTDSLVNGHTHNVTYSAKGTEVGDYAGIITPMADVVISNGTTDVTANYDITVTNGQLTIAKTDETFAISLGNDTCDYDANEHFNTKTASSTALTGTTTFSYSFEQDGSYVSDLTSLTRVNVGEYTIYVKAVNPNYQNEATTTAKLTILLPPLTVTAKDSTKVYDGTTLHATYSMEAIALDPTVRYKVMNGNTWSDTYTTEVPGITNVGTLTYLVEATANSYSVSDTATLTVTKRDVAVSVGDTLGIEYTGGEHHSEKEPLFSNVLPGQSPHIGYEHAKGTLVGTYYGQYAANSFVVMDGETDVTANYNLTDTVKGALTIVTRTTPYPVTVVAHSDTGHVYDGQPHSATGYDTTVHVGEHYFTVEGLTTSNPTSTNACELPNGFSGTAVVKDVHGNDVTAQFNVSTVNGLLRIAKRPVILRSLPGIKMYDGTPLTLSQQTDVIVEGSGFVEGEGATYNITGSQTLVGMSYNTFTYTLKEGTLAGNYDITTQFGTLTVTADTCRISVASESEEWIYDGTSHRRDVYTVKYNNTLLDSLSGSNGKVFVLPTHDTLTVTSTFGGITTVGENAAHNNTFTYTLQHDGQYVGLRDTVYGTLEILPRPVTVRIVGRAKAVTYDGNPHTVTGYEVHEIDEPLYQASYFGFTGNPGDSAATRTDEGTTYMSLTSSQFQNQNPNFAVTFVVTKGEMVVAPAGGVVVIISGNSNTVNYDGEPHEVTGYTIVSISNPTYLESYIEFTGSAAASRTEVGTTWMGLSPDQFHNTQSNFSNVVFQLQSDGYQTINRPEVLVDITGHHAVHVYDGSEHSVQGYEVVTSNPLYTRSKFNFSGDSVATQRDAGVKLMNLKNTQFVNNDTNFLVIFEVLEDGYQEITPNTTAMTLTCPAGETVSKVYDGTPLSVAATATSSISSDETFEILYKSKLEGESTFSDWSATPPSITDFGILLVEVSCSNPNYQSQTCSYSLSIHKREVHLASMDSTRLYNGDLLTYDSVVVSGHGFAQGEGATYAVTGSQLLPGASPNEFTYTLNSNTKADNYQITTAYGTLHVDERPDSLLYPISVVSNSNPVATGASIFYDGLKHADSNFVTLTFTTVDNHTYTVTGLTAKVSAYDAGTYPNTIHGNPVVLDEYGNDVTDQFHVELQEGDLVIRRHPVTITVPDEVATMMYNGDSLKVDLENIHISYLADRDTLKEGYIITEGYTEGVYHCNDGFFMATTGIASQHGFRIIHGAGEEYAAGSSLANYKPSFSVALTITKRPLEITAASAEKVYDGEALTLTASDYTLTGGTTLAPTDTLIITRNGAQTCVGETANHIVSVKVLHKGDLVDVTSSYDIATVDGLIKVTPDDGLICPAALHITLTEGTYDTLVAQSLLGPIHHALADAGVAAITNNLDEQNPMTVGTYSVKWVLSDACHTGMDSCNQAVEVAYAPCEGVTCHGHFYAAKRIGYQCWMTENLRETLNSGDEAIASYHAYKESSANLDKFGYLYSWYSAMNVSEGDDTAVPAAMTGDNGQPYVQGICPDGWAVGSLQDYTVLFDTVGDNILLKDAGDGYWLPDFGGTLPNSGFNVRGNGFFNSATQRYEDFLTGAHLWMPESTSSAGTVNSVVFQYYCADGLFQQNPKGHLKGVRCIRKVAP